MAVAGKQGSCVLIYAIHRTQDWWRHVGENMGFDRVEVLTDRRGVGSRWVTDRFYEAYRRYLATRAESSGLMSTDEVADCIARCRVLRWLPRRRAVAMVLGMAEAMDEVLEDVRPELIVSFPIDNYVQDNLARRARARDIPYFELTTSALPNMSMLLHRGRLMTSSAPVDPAVVEEKVHEIADPLFQPVYVKGQKPYTRLRFLATVAYFRLRGLAFKAYSVLRRDTLNFHYLDAQSFPGHKPRWRDIGVLKLTDTDWRTRLVAFPPEKRVLFGLQLFPEAAIDYWIDPLDLVAHEQMLVRAAKAFSGAGYQVVVKDHPLQFGHRRIELIEALKALPNVVVAPYDVSGAELLGLCHVNLTATGTLGLQAALCGKVSVVGEAYYAQDADFIILRSATQLDDLPALVERHSIRGTLADRQFRIAERLLSGSFDGDYYSFLGFNPASPNPGATALGRQLGERVRQLGPAGEAWHDRSLPPGSGSAPGSPLN